MSDFIIIARHPDSGPAADPRHWFQWAGAGHDAGMLANAMADAGFTLLYPPMDQYHPFSRLFRYRHNEPDECFYLENDRCRLSYAPGADVIPYLLFIPKPPDDESLHFDTNPVETPSVVFGKNKINEVLRLPTAPGTGDDRLFEKFGGALRCTQIGVEPNMPLQKFVGFAPGDFQAPEQPFAWINPGIFRVSLDGDNIPDGGGPPAGERPFDVARQIWRRVADSALDAALVGHPEDAFAWRAWADLGRRICGDAPRSRATRFLFGPRGRDLTRAAKGLFILARLGGWFEWPGEPEAGEPADTVPLWHAPETFASNALWLAKLAASWWGGSVVRHAPGDGDPVVMRRPEFPMRLPPALWQTPVEKEPDEPWRRFFARFLAANNGGAAPVAAFNWLGKVMSRAPVDSPWKSLPGLFRRSEANGQYFDALSCLEHGMNTLFLPHDARLLVRIPAGGAARPDGRPTHVDLFRSPQEGAGGVLCRLLRVEPAEPDDGGVAAAPGWWSEWWRRFFAQRLEEPLRITGVAPFTLGISRLDRDAFEPGPDDQAKIHV